MTPPRPYRLGNGRIVTPANPALVWDHPIIAMAHDVAVVENLLGAGRFSREVEPALVAEPRRRKKRDSDFRTYEADEALRVPSR